MDQNKTKCNVCGLWSESWLQWGQYSRKIQVFLDWTMQFVLVNNFWYWQTGTEQGVFGVICQSIWFEFQTQIQTMWNLIQNAFRMTSKEFLRISRQMASTMNLGIRQNFQNLGSWMDWQIHAAVSPFLVRRVRWLHCCRRSGVRLSHTDNGHAMYHSLEEINCFFINSRVRSCCRIEVDERSWIFRRR